MTASHPTDKKPEPERHPTLSQPSPAHPTFNRSHCFMTGPLSRPEVEEVGALIATEIQREEAIIAFVTGYFALDQVSMADLDEKRHRIKRLRAILDKMDYPQPELPK